ncbi:helix-turn-helix domain-containing protein [Dokdonella sp.]|uniref:helix-turn-helix domain-containing protein n=1 Tax=Dokdonella sp. TaxID=2291710 RepID=UPI0035285ED8
MKNPSSAEAHSCLKLSDRVRSARRKASISQTEFARRIGVSPSAVAQWEHPNGTQPSLQSVVRILEITGACPNWLLLGSSNKQGKQGSKAGEASALALEMYAHCLDEENLLTIFRKIPTSRRSLLMSMAEELAAPRLPESRKPR